MVFASRREGLSTSEERRLARSGRLETGIRRVTPGKSTEPLARGTRGSLVVLLDPILYPDATSGKDGNPGGKDVKLGEWEMENVERMGREWKQIIETKRWTDGEMEILEWRR